MSITQSSREEATRYEKAIEEAAFQLQVAEGYFVWLSALFTAIAKEGGEHHQATQLAKMGQYLADVASNDADCAREALEELEEAQL